MFESTRKTFRWSSKVYASREFLLVVLQRNTIWIYRQKLDAVDAKLPVLNHVPILVGACQLVKDVRQS